MNQTELISSPELYQHNNKALSGGVGGSWGKPKKTILHFSSQQQDIPSIDFANASITKV